MIEIKKMEVDDINRIFEFEQDNFNQDSYAIKTIQENLANKQVINLVAKEFNKVLGYLNASWFCEDANILKIGVVKECRRQGIGTLLLKKLIDLLQKNGVKKLFLEVDENNFTAINFYKNFNFKTTRVRMNYYKNGDAGIEMLLDID